MLLFQAIVQLFRGTNCTSRMRLNLEYHGNHRVLIRRLRVQFKLDAVFERLDRTNQQWLNSNKGAREEHM